MPINPNIALGVQQPQPVNMLGQVGQMLALKAATEETRGNEEMRNLFSSGVNFDDPEFQKRGYMANPKAFQELLGKRATTQKTEIEALSKEIDLRRDAIGNIRTPEDYLNWHDANHTGRLGSFFKSAGINPSRESIIAQLNQPGGLDKLKRESALGATKLQQELMQTERTRISSAPSYMNAQLNREKFNLEQQSQKSIQNVLADQVGPQGEPPSNVNALTGGGDVQQRVAQIDARIQQLVGLGTPDALRAADVLFKQRNVLSPSTGAVPGAIQEFNLAKQQGFTGTFMDFQKERAALNAYGQPQEVTRRLEDGTSVTELVYPNPVKQTITPLSNLVRTEAPQGAGGGAPVQTPATAGKMQLKEEGRENVEIVLDSLYDRYANLAKEGGITDTSKGTLANIKARAGASAAGQLVGSYTGSKEQEFRDSILQTRPLLLNAIKNATGMSAQQLNSNVELQTYLAVSTDPTKSIQANIEAMNNISKMFGLKKKFEMPSSAKSSSASATIEAPKDLPADIRELWKYMTPEDRKLWK
jgi:hypothetical protein